MEYVSSLGGFANDPTNLYAGPVGAFPGVASDDGFQFAALYMPTADLNGGETLWCNEVGLFGWRIRIVPSAVVNNPPNAIDIHIQVNGNDTAVATLLNTHPGVPVLVHAHVYNSAGALIVDLYVNGVLAASTSTPATAYAPSPGQPFVGTNQPGGEGALNSRILGVMYHEGPSPAGVTPASFYIATREAETLVAGLDNDATVTWGNIYTVQRGLSGRGIVPTGNNGPLPPTIWTPDVGIVPLTRTGTQLTVRGHKNIDWHAAIFATLDVP